MRPRVLLAALFVAKSVGKLFERWLNQQDLEPPLRVLLLRVVKALVVLRSGTSASQEQIVEFCSSRLAGFQRPRSVAFVDALPRNASGKVLKHVLREPYWSGRQRRVGGA